MIRVLRRIQRRAWVRNRGGPTGADPTLRPAVVAGLLVTLATLVAGCFLPPSVHIPADLRTASVAGVVDEVIRLPDGRVSYQLANGETAEIASQKVVLLGGEPLVGELLLAGTDPDGHQWVAGVSGDWPGRPPGCYLFPAQGRAKDGWIETESGFRLPKAADFSDPRDNPSDLFTSDQGMFCLNDQGEVTSYDVR